MVANRQMPKSPGYPFATQLVDKLNQALALHQAGHLDHAKFLYEAILKAQPRHFDALHFLGVIAYQKRKFKAAVELMEKAIAINPGFPVIYSNRGNALKELAQFEAALASYNKAISLKPDYAEAYNKRGEVLQDLKQIEEALPRYDKAIAIKHCLENSTRWKPL